MMRMQMKLDRKERRVDRREQRCQQAEWTGLVSSLVGGIAAALGVEPRPAKKVKKSIRDNNIIHDNNCHDNDSRSSNDSNLSEQFKKLKYISGCDPLTTIVAMLVACFSVVKEIKNGPNGPPNLDSMLFLVGASPALQM